MDDFLRLLRQVVAFIADCQQAGRLNRIAVPSDKGCASRINRRLVMRALLLGIALAALIAAPAMACGSIGKGGAALPPPAAAIDRLLPDAKLSTADMEKVTALRAQITDAVAAGQETAAREAETQAMQILGYQKAFTRCGPGSFMWRKI
jgi:hypothetical protein